MDKTLREMARILNVREEDVPRTLARFRKEIEELKSSQ
jgi:transposase-like protein